MTTVATDLDAVRTAQLFHALSDATRLEIIQCLMGGERCVCELTDDLDAAQSRLSFHLRTLKDAGLVSDRREGRWVYYMLNREALAEMEGVLATLKTPVERTGRNCC
jgi:ArsR family transcriptional regulator